jgi:putative endonuclease
MTKSLNRTTGNKGEAAAAEKLVSEGYEILGRNYRNKWGEVDLVAKNNNTIVFVEVKTKSGSQFGEPWEMINNWKIQQVERIGKMWCDEYGWKGLCRVDVVGVWMKGEEVERIEHWENVGE